MVIGGSLRATERLEISLHLIRGFLLFTSNTHDPHIRHHACHLISHGSEPTRPVNDFARMAF